MLQLEIKQAELFQQAVVLATESKACKALSNLMHALSFKASVVP
jgi:hypothetical protein